jgi:hypothetical protein
MRNKNKNIDQRELLSQDYLNLGTLVVGLKGLYKVDTFALTLLSLILSFKCIVCCSHSSNVICQ